MQPSIVPFAKSLYLCKHQIGYADRSVDLYGIFNAHYPSNGYPVSDFKFCAFAQLSHGLGVVPFHFDIRDAVNGELIWTTGERQLHFSSRRQIVQLAMTIENCPFDRPGVYLVELYCRGEWLCDARLELR
jgi:hypothetical protein